MRKVGENGEVGGIAPWLLGIDAPAPRSSKFYIHFQTSDSDAGFTICSAFDIFSRACTQKRSICTFVLKISDFFFRFLISILGPK